MTELFFFFFFWRFFCIGIYYFFCSGIYYFFAVGFIIFLHWDLFFPVMTEHFKHLLKTFSSFGFVAMPALFPRNLLFYFLISFIKFSHDRDISQFVIIEHFEAIWRWRWRWRWLCKVGGFGGARSRESIKTSLWENSDREKTMAMVMITKWIDLTMMMRMVMMIII